MRWRIQDLSQMPAILMSTSRRSVHTGKVVRGASISTTSSSSSTAAGVAGRGLNNEDLLEGPSKRPLESFFRQSFLAKRISQASGQAEVAEDARLQESTHTMDNNNNALSRHAKLSPRTVLETIPPMATPSSSWRPLDRPRSLRAQLGVYKQLAKGRLTAWVVLSAMVGYTMCPTDPATAALAMEALVQDTFGSTAVASLGSSFTQSGLSATESALNTFRVTTLLATATGTALCSASANTFNQLLEIPYDAQMPRTAKRPLPSNLITPLHAFSFASISGMTGLALLYSVNPLTASLGLLNIVLYAAVYTPLKRLSVINTWIGAIVGGIPPLMGWAACTNSLDPFSGQAGAWVLALILFAWQFPHFNALSWTIRSEYARGGYRMLSAINPAMNARVSLRWTIAGAAAAAVGAPLVGLTSWPVGMATLLPSGALGFYAWRFWRAGSPRAMQAARQHGIMRTVPGARASDKDPRDPSARSLFFMSLVHLPVLLFIMMAGTFFERWLDRRADAAQGDQLDPTLPQLASSDMSKA